MTNLIGQSLGRYHILEQLGEGGMATVYKAYDTRLETDVAVKVIRTENILPSVLERSLKRFEREAKSLARLTHPNIVKVTDYGEFEGKPYLVMPYLPGGTLKDRIKQGPIPWQEAVRLLLPIARALSYAHEHNIIHRDVKPSNILLTEKGEPMLTDFGVAKLFDMDATADLTGTGMGVGTPEYMAPEQWQGQVSTQTDVYALGVVLYEMVTGRRPYTADTPAAIMMKQATESLPRPKNYVRNLPDKIERVLTISLAKLPKDRYSSCGGIANELENIREKGKMKPSFTETHVNTKQPREINHPVVGAGRVESKTSSEGSIISSKSLNDQLRKSGHRSGMMILLSILPALIIGGVSVYFLFGTSKSPSLIIIVLVAYLVFDFLATRWFYKTGKN